jgi:enterobactin synthetase component D
VHDARDVETSFPGVAPAPSLASATRKRQIEFAAGRYCVREALRILAPELAEANIGSGRNREPLWPPGIVGAITHTHGYASAAVARTSDARAIGLDAEIEMDADVAADVADSIADRSEIEVVERTMGVAFPRALTLIFSAKETVFKCLFPEVRRYFDFRDVRFQSVDPKRGEFAAEILVPLSRSLPAGRVLLGRYEHDEKLVWTAMVITG